MAIELGVGGNQHYSATARRYFTNIVDVAVGDLDGDGIEDIVAVANAIPENSAYSSLTPRPYNKFSHYHHTFPFLGGLFLASTDALWGVGDSLSGFNPDTTSLGWFLTPPLSNEPNAQTAHFSPPSPNVVAGMVATPAYTGSDVAWFRGDGQGHFELRFITPLDGTGNPTPTRIRMANGIRLARMRSNGPGLDIILTSGSDLDSTQYYPTDSTSIEPYTGTGRVFWLENRGWEGGVVGTRLNFIDHGIAEYNYDRLPVIFYTHLSPWKPVVSMSPQDIDIFDVNNDGRLDVLIANTKMSSPGRACGTQTFFSTDTARGDVWLNTTFSPSILSHARPHNGDRWTVTQSPFSSGPQQRLFWYENTDPGTGSASISTATFQPVLNGTNLSFTSQIYGKVVRLRSGGAEFFVDITPSSGSPYLRIYRRDLTVPNSLKIDLTSTQFPTPPATNWKVYNAVAGDVNMDGNDELILNDFYCQGGACYDRIKVFTVSPSSPDDVAISQKFSMISVDGPTEHFMPPGDLKVVDFNNDGKRDLLVPSRGQDNSANYAGTLFLNTTQNGGADITFRTFQQRTPSILSQVAMKNSFNQVGFNGLGRMVSIATGDLNRDGFIDFVRVGPNLPMTIFLNNLSGMQRARVKAVAVHAAGTSAEIRKEWNSTFGGELTTTGTVRISTAALGAMNVQSVTSE